MTVVEVPKREEVSPSNQTIFDNLQSKVGFVPNLFAVFAHSENALANYLAFQNGRSSISAKDREVVDLVVSEVNSCEYCLAGHTVISKNLGYSDEQIFEIRSGKAGFDPKLDALARLVRNITRSIEGTPMRLSLTRFSPQAGRRKTSLMQSS